MTITTGHSGSSDMVADRRVDAGFALWVASLLGERVRTDALAAVLGVPGPELACVFDTLVAADLLHPEPPHGHRLTATPAPIPVTACPDELAACARRAFRAGFVDASVELAAQAFARSPGRPEMLLALATLLLCAGRPGEVLGLAGPIAAVRAPSAIVLGLRCALAQAARLCGRFADSARHLMSAREVVLTAEQPLSAVDTAVLDVLTAALLLVEPTAGGQRVAMATLRGVVPIAERAGRDSLTCWALLELADAVERSDPRLAGVYLRRVTTVAGRAHIVPPRTEAVLRMGTTDWLRDGDTTALRHARVLATGTRGHIDTVNVLLTLDAVLRAEPVATGRAEAPRSRDAVVRRLGGSFAVVDALAAAHHGDRSEWTARLTALSPRERRLAVVPGLGGAFRALLEDNIPLARAELSVAAALDAESPGPLTGLAGRFGLGLLLDALDGRVDTADIPAAPATGWRWNRQFAGLARAVVLGRANRRSDASTLALRVSDPNYPMARHLGRWLVASSAHEHGWGDPLHWLRQAEDYFFATGNAVLVASCRRQQRAMGAQLRQRRRGSDGIPDRLRTAGITCREYEVLRLIGESATNRGIAATLRLSPRTVERHVANLLAKTGRANRVELSEFLRASC